MQVVLFANGFCTQGDLDRARRLSPDLVMAVDGGLRWLHLLGWHPHVYIGDEDSASREQTRALEVQGTEVLRFPPDKDETDLELALLEAVHRGARELHVFAALGGRWDQTLANLLLVLHPEIRGRAVFFYADGQILFPVYDHAVIRGHPGDTVSFLALGGPARGVTLTGFRYPLREGEFLPGSTLGVSNALVAPEARVTVREGTLLAIWIPRGVQERIEAHKALHDDMRGHTSSSPGGAP